jgi:hypothetical protein
MTRKYTHEELVERVKSPGWATKDGQVTGSLEDVLTAAHKDRKGPIAELETEIELDMIQIEKLWLYLGLPV